MSGTPPTGESVPTGVPADVRIVSPAPRETWRAIMKSDPAAVATQAPEWMDCLAGRGYTDASRLYELPSGRRLLLPLAARRVGGLAVSEESWPYGWGYGGLLVEGGGLTEADCRLVLDDLAARPAVLRAVTPMPLAGADWSSALTSGTTPARIRRVGYTSQVVDLDGGFEQVWTSRYRRQARNSVRKAERFALDVERETGATPNPRGLPIFAELYGRSVDRWAIQRGQPLPIARYLARRRDRPGQVAAAAAALGARCVIWTVSRGGEPVAVNVVLQSEENSVGWLCAMNEELARETLATYLLHSIAIEDSCKAGIHWFHMGESDAGSGAEHFKKYFGATPVPYDVLRYERLPLSAAEQRARWAFATGSAGLAKVKAGLRRLASTRTSAPAEAVTDAQPGSLTGAQRSAQAGAAGSASATDPAGAARSGGQGAEPGDRG